MLSALLVAALVGNAVVARWDADALGPRVATEAPPPLAPDELAVMTINAWLLSQPHRVAPLIQAIDAEGATLDGANARPALVGIQEIQSRAAVAELESALRDEGFFEACECSVRSDGSLRSAVAAAVRRPYAVRAHECIGLRQLLPDQRRCALLARVVDPEGREITFVVTHLAWHFSNGPMADWLRHALETRAAMTARSIVVGDLNAWPGAEGYARMTRAPLRDARPDAPPTHFLGWKIDHVLVGDAFEVVRGLDRRASFERIRPAATFLRPSVCHEHGPPECPVSDHLPEAVVLRWRAESAPR